LADAEWAAAQACSALFAAKSRRGLR